MDVIYREMIKFGVVGALAFVIDLGLVRDDGEGFTETNERGLLYSFRFTAQVYLPAILEGEGAWSTATFDQTTPAASGRRVLDAFFPVGGPSAPPSPFSPNPRRV